MTSGEASFSDVVEKTDQTFQEKIVTISHWMKRMDTNKKILQL